MTDWDTTLQNWIKPPSDAEEARRDNTEALIRTALDDYKPLPNAVIRVFAQGSYKNKTNVRLLSDVDIAVEFQEDETVPTLTPRIATTDRLGSAKDLTKADLGLTDRGKFEPESFKDHVEAAMIGRFGAPSVDRGNKAIRIRESASTIKADVVPCFPHRRYDSELDVHRGIRIFPDEGRAIENYPQQHYDNGVAKNNTTGRRYKRMVRAFKRMAFHLSTTDEPQIPSFNIECMVFNVPDSYFGIGTYLDDFQAIAEYMWFHTYKVERCEGWEEVNRLKYLFRGSPDGKRSTASDFAWQAWKLVENT